MPKLPSNPVPKYIIVQLDRQIVKLDNAIKERVERVLALKKLRATLVSTKKEKGDTDPET